MGFFLACLWYLLSCLSLVLAFLLVFSAFFLWSFLSVGEKGEGLVSAVLWAWHFFPDVLC